MDRALYAAASGMAAQQLNLDVIANNLANADVAGFKGSAPSFTELAAPGETGLGTMPLGEHVLFAQGRLSSATGSFDVAIDGPGFFAVVDDRGHRAYTRDGEFSRAGDGTLRNAGGQKLLGLRIPSDALSASVAEDGRAIVVTAHGRREVGRIRLAEFEAPEHLRSVGGTLFEATQASGRARFVDAGGSGPHIRFGMLEESNVSIIEAMMSMLAAQRAYEADAKGVQAADEMLRIANNLQRG
ncbi:MAG TPA: flagellar hook-basal body protein [Candidatus Tyrphobacter sp.]